MIEETVTAIASKPGPIQPDIVEALSAGAMPATSHPFEGMWTCRSDTFAPGQIAFQFGPDFVTGPAFGRTVKYADVTMIGGRETAYLVNLVDGQQAGLLEIEPERMIIAAAGSLFDCLRETQP